METIWQSCFTRSLHCSKEPPDQTKNIRKMHVRHVTVISHLKEKKGLVKSNLRKVFIVRFTLRARSSSVSASMPRHLHRHRVHAGASPTAAGPRWRLPNRRRVHAAHPPPPPSRSSPVSPSSTPSRSSAYRLIVA
jgi:hypothetical protein